MLRRRNHVTQMSTRIREDKIKITLIPTCEISLRMTVLQHVINRKHLKPCITLLRGMVAEGSGCWLFPGFLAYLITGLCNQGALFQPVGLGPSRKHACWLAFITNSQLGLKQARKGTAIVLTWESLALKACTKELSETSRALRSTIAKVINLRGKEPEGQGGQG